MIGGSSVLPSGSARLLCDRNGRCIPVFLSGVSPSHTSYEMRTEKIYAITVRKYATPLGSLPYNSRYG